MEGPPHARKQARDGLLLRCTENIAAGGVRGVSDARKQIAHHEAEAVLHRGGRRDANERQRPASAGFHAPAPSEEADHKRDKQRTAFAFRITLAGAEGGGARKEFSREHSVKSAQALQKREK
jgi:hypothetical protein